MEILLKNVEKRINDLYVPDMNYSSGNPVINMNCEIRGGINITSPIFIITDSVGVNLWEYNYAYVPNWNRYYFINNIDFDGHIIYLECVEDYLASFCDSISNSTFYCTRCVSDYDENLTDIFFPSKANSITKHQVVQSPWKDLTNGMYVIAITSGGNDSPHIGSNAYYILSDTEITQFMEDLLSKADLTISGIVESMVRTMVNPIQYIRSVYWFPFELDCETTEVDNISFGWWKSDTPAQVMNGQFISNLYTNFEVEIPFDELMFEDDERNYMKFAPYSQYVLTCFPFGSVKLSNDIVSQYVKGNPLEIELIVDHITGMGEFILYCGEGNDIPHMVFTTQIAIEIPVGEILQDYAGVILNSASAIGSAFTGHVARALTDVYNAIDSVVPNATAQGTAGGFAQLMVGANWHLNRYYQEIEIDPELVGEPCCKNERVGSLKGFAKFSNVEMAGNMLEDELQAINSLLEEGIFVGEENA